MNLGTQSEYSPHPEPNTYPVDDATTPRPTLESPSVATKGGKGGKAKTIARCAASPPFFLSLFISMPLPCTLHQMRRRTSAARIREDEAAVKYTQKLTP